MKRTFLLSLRLLLLASLAACHKNTPEPEVAGPLEGHWQHLNTAHTEYDQQGKVVASYPVGGNDMEKIIITATEIEYFYGPPAYFTQKFFYTRTEDKVQIDTMKSQSFAYTIKNLTQSKLDLLLIEEPRQSGSQLTHYEHLFQFERE